MKQRIWELDVLRGVCILGMIFFHLIFDLVYLFGLVTLSPGWEAVCGLANDWGGVPFFLVSGICVTFSTRPVRRGLQVIGCSLLVSAVTVGMYLMDFAGPDMIIYFGVLQCLGVCMVLWPLFRKLPSSVLAVLGVLLAAVGIYWAYHVRVDFPWLIPLGLLTETFTTSDYFPLLPNLGYFLMGAVLGRVLYPTRRTLLPKVNDRNPVIRFLGFWGKHSLLIYLLHQPVLAALVAGWALLFT